MLFRSRDRRLQRLTLDSDEAQGPHTHFTLYLNFPSLFLSFPPPLPPSLSTFPPPPSLVEEEAGIRAAGASLQQQLSGARASLASLEQSRMALEKDLGCKRNSLLIDLHKCLAHRARYPSVTALSGH